MDLTVCSLRNVAIYIFYKIYYKGKWTVHCQVRLMSTFKYEAERGVSETHKLPNICLIFTTPQKNPIYHQQPTGSVHGGLNNIQQDTMHYFVIFRVTNTNGVVDYGRYDKVIQMSNSGIFKRTGMGQNPGQKQICGTLSGTCAIFRLVPANDLLHPSVCFLN